MIAKYIASSVLVWIIAYVILPQNIAGFLSFVAKIFTSHLIAIKIKNCLEKKSNEYIEVNELYSGLGGYLMWIIYGLFLTNNAFIWIPNLVYLFLYIFFLISYLWTIGKITDEGLLIVYLKKIFQVETIEVDNDPKQIKKKLRDDF